MRVECSTQLAQLRDVTKRANYIRLAQDLSSRDLNSKLVRWRLASNKIR